MNLLYLIRHAEPVSFHEWDGGDETRPLSAKGEIQAFAQAKRAKAEGIQAVKSSPYQRAFETAKIIADHCGLEVEIVGDLSLMNQFKATPPMQNEVWVAHANNIPHAVFEAGAPCNACSHASAWRLEFDENNAVTSSSYIEP
ncbi:phosphoglycerate mutase family protein [Planctomycetota bacterium]|nr:phosphoglycerate mutase family protein [Planctomycetota bacterium]